MNVAAVAFGGTAKDRRDVANSILGNAKPKLSTDELQKILGGDFLANPIVQSATEQEARAWADKELSNNPELAKRLQYGK
jgi:hypothetical protein